MIVHGFRSKIFSIFLFLKLDIADGFWRVHSWNFCYVLPEINQKVEFNLDDFKIVVPHSLQMGWTESPSFFYTASETARNVAETLITINAQVHVHPLEMYCVPPKKWKDYPVNFRKNFTSQLEMYMDDFSAMSQCTSSTQLNHISRRLLHAVHFVFPPPSISKHRGLDPVSIKKLKQGEGLWEFCKIILGCLFDGIERTITLPTEKLNFIAKEIKVVYRKKATHPQTFSTARRKIATRSVWYSNEKGFIYSTAYSSEG